MKPIEPARLYSFSQARNLIPSPRGGRVDVKTLHRWREAGVFQAVARTVFRRRYWFVLGSEIIRLIEGKPPAEALFKNKKPRTAIQHARAQEQARRDLAIFYPRQIA
jgi:hypothetical protein